VKFAPVLLTVIMLLASACGGDSRPPNLDASGADDMELSDAELREELAQLLSDTPLDENGRECVTDAVMGELDRDTIVAMASAETTASLPKLQLDAITDAVVTCS
jgi:hypothetical protein